jgi:hypothetical protein
LTYNKYLIIFAVGVFIFGILSVSLFSDQFVDANSRKKIQFTQTITSIQDPGQGHEDHQIAIILSPSEGTLYDGSLTFTSSEPVQIVVLHEISKSDSKGQPIWTIDGEKIYALSLIEKETKSDSFEFTGSALALHSKNSKEFTATVSVDGWIRGQPTEIVMQQFNVEKKPTISLSNENIPTTIPMHKGIFNATSLFYIITDSSDQDLGKLISEKQNWKVELAPTLAKIPEAPTQEVFVFTNGIAGNGIFGFQDEVFSSTPNQETDYSPLSSVIEVSWKKGQNKTIFESAEEILKAKEGERIEFKETGIVLNTPQIKWSEGQIPIRNSTEITDGSSYAGGQVLKINEDEMNVTFVAHRAWGPDGRTIYFIITDATPSNPAQMMGVVYSPRISEILYNSTSGDLYQFKNGIKGSGPTGFQPSISATVPGDENYTPIWRIHTVEWNNEDEAKLLETKRDIDSLKENDVLTVSLANPMSVNHLLNSPIIDPFQ